MSSAAQIPLSGIGPPIENPTQQLGQLVSLQDALARRPLIQEQTRAAQLENAQRESQARAQQSLNDAMQQNVTAGPDGFPVIDHAGVAKHLAEAGAGSAIPGYMQGALKARQEQATAMKTDLANRDSILTNTAQLLQGVKDDTGYQAVLPHARANLQKLGLDQTLLPDAFDAGRISTAIAAGTKISDFNKQLQQHADLTFKIAGGAPKTIEAWSNNVYKDLSAAGSQGQLEAIKEKYRTLAQNPEFSKYLPQSLVDSIPDQWTPDVPEAAKLRLVAPEKQPGYQQKKRENLASDLLGALSGGPQAYQAAVDALPHGTARTLPAAEALFDGTGKPLPEAKDTLEKFGMTPEQMAKTEQEQAKVQIARDALKKAGSEAELARRAAAGDADAKAALGLLANQTIRKEVGKQMGVFNALSGMGAVGGGGAAPPPAGSPTDAIRPAAGRAPSPPAPTAGSPPPPGPSGGTAQSTPPPSTGTPGKNEAVLEKLNPGIAAEIRAVAEGRLPLWPTSRMNPMNEVKRNLLLRYDPTFDFTNASARTKTAQGFSPSGTQGQAINAFDTALRHASVLSDLIDNLDSTNFRKYNSLSNWVKTESGSDEVKRFNNVRQKFANELVKAWRGTGGAEADIKAEVDNLNAADSPKQLASQIADDVDLLRGKVGALEDQYRQTMNKEPQFVSKTAQQAIDKIKGKSSGSSSQNKVTLKDGRVATFPDQKSADAFKKAHPDKVQ